MTDVSDVSDVSDRADVPDLWTDDALAVEGVPWTPYVAYRRRKGVSADAPTRADALRLTPSEGDVRHGKRLQEAGLAWLTHVLDATGQFTSIKATSATPDRQYGLLLAQKKPSYVEDREPFLFSVQLHTHAPGSLEQVLADMDWASSRGIATILIGTKYLDSEGWMFRRGLREQDRRSGREYGEAAAHRKRSLRHPEAQRLNMPSTPDNAIDTRGLERDIFLAHQVTPFYLQPASSRLGAAVRRFAFRPVWMYHEGQQRPLVQSVKWYDPLPLETLTHFTLVPQPKIAARKTPYLMGDLMALPSVENPYKGTTSNTRHMRHEFGRLVDAIARLEFSAMSPWLYDGRAPSLDTDRLEALRMHVMRTIRGRATWAEAGGELNAHLSALYELLPGAASVRDDFQPDRQEFVAHYPSRSNPGTMHTSRLRVPDGKIDSARFDCSCPGHQYLDKCWHERDLYARVGAKQR